MGSTVNSLLCKMENIILQCILKYCRRNKITVGTLCFDGLLVKDKVEVEKLEEFIFSELGMKLEIIEKNFNLALGYADLNKNLKKKIEEILKTKHEYIPTNNK